jgi:hypothetical protein
MKYVLPFILFVFVLNTSIAQHIIVYNRIVSAHSMRYTILKNDSVNFSLNDQYCLIDDSCAQIIRHGHFKLKQRLFFGKIKDVSKADSSLVVTEGTYSANGLKNGGFITHYLNGNLQAKGIFKNNKYDGKWEVYYEDGKPELNFEVIDNDIRITDAWKADGAKTVDNGNGTYQADQDRYYWKGRLVNGKPDGKWKFISKEDATETPMASENFKKGKFHSGTSPIGEYTDSTRIVLVDPNMLPFTNAEKFRISLTACDGSGFKHIVNAQYREGSNQFSEEIKKAASPIFRRINIMALNGSLTIKGEVNENGALDKLHSDDNNTTDLVNSLEYNLSTLPLLQPATANGKPIKEKFIIKFTFEGGMYTFTYSFSPIQ